jgi:hypothetical protein
MIIRKGLKTGNECKKREEKSVLRKRINERHGRKHGRVVRGQAGSDGFLYKSIIFEQRVPIDEHRPHLSAPALKCDRPENPHFGQNAALQGSLPTSNSTPRVLCFEAQSQDLSVAGFVNLGPEGYPLRSRYRNTWFSCIWPLLFSHFWSHRIHLGPSCPA